MEEGELLTSRVPRALDLKSKLFGFELPDLLAIFFNLAITNLIFGASRYRYLLVWGTTSVIALSLYFLKKGKPDSYLQHLGEYLLSPTVRFSGLQDTKAKAFKRKDTNA